MKTVKELREQYLFDKRSGAERLAATIEGRVKATFTTPAKETFVKFHCKSFDYEVLAPELSKAGYTHTFQAYHPDSFNGRLIVEWEQ